VTATNLRIAEYPLSSVTGVVMNGYAGNDRLDVNEWDGPCTVPVTVNGGAGDDMVFGGGGADLLRGGQGADYLNGAGGNDTVFGGAQRDLLYGGPGNDLIVAGTGYDRCYAGAGDDSIYGEQGNDQIFGSDGNDLIFGGPGNEVIQGDDGSDTVRGGIGDDELNGGGGVDEMLGRGGADRFAIDSANPSEFTDGDSTDSTFTASPNSDFAALITTVLTEEFPNINIESVEADEVNQLFNVRFTYTLTDRPGIFNMLILNPGNTLENPDLTWYEIHPAAASEEFLQAFPTLRPGASVTSMMVCDMFLDGVRNGRGYKVTYQIPETGATGILLCMSETGQEFPPGTVAAF